MVAIAIEHSNLHRWAIHNLTLEFCFRNSMIQFKTCWAEGSTDGGKFPPAGSAGLYVANCCALHVDL